MNKSSGMSDSDFSKTFEQIIMAVERCSDDQLIGLADALHERVRVRRRARFGVVQMDDLIITDRAPLAMTAG